MSAHLTALDDAAWDSPWRCRRVGDKVATSVALILAALVSPTWPATFIIAVLSCLFILGWAKVPPRVLWHAMVAPLVFLVIGAVSVMISMGSTRSPDDWWHWWILSMNPTSFRMGIALFAHGAAGTLAIMVLATTTPMVDVLTWLRKLHIPDALLEIASLTYRLIFVFLDCMFGVMEAQRARLGDCPAGEHPHRRRWNNTAAAVGVIAMRSWRRAERLNDGMVNRGFDSAFVTLALKHERSLALAVVGVGSAVATWLLSWAVAGHPWR